MPSVTVQLTRYLIGTDVRDLSEAETGIYPVGKHMFIGHGLAAHQKWPCDGIDVRKTMPDCETVRQPRGRGFPSLWNDHYLAMTYQRPIQAYILKKELTAFPMEGHPAPMTLPAPLFETIAAVASIMGGARDPWWIASGAAAALYGARPIIVSDVDVLLSVEDAGRLFPRIGIAPAPPSDHPRFRSDIFGRWEAGPLVVEFMANFRLKELDGIWRPVAPMTRQPVSVGAATVFVPELGELRTMFERFEREQDRERIKLLGQLL